MELNAKQQAAVDMASDWYRKKNDPIFKLVGYAGTGKTTVDAALFIRVDKEKSLSLETTNGGPAELYFTINSASILTNFGGKRNNIYKLRTDGPRKDNPAQM